MTPWKKSRRGGWARTHPARFPANRTAEPLRRSCHPSCLEPRRYGPIQRRGNTHEDIIAASSTACMSAIGICAASCSAASYDPCRLLAEPRHCCVSGSPPRDRFRRVIDHPGRNEGSPTGSITALKARSAADGLHDPARKAGRDQPTERDHVEHDGPPEDRLERLLDSLVTELLLGNQRAGPAAGE